MKVTILGYEFSANKITKQSEMTEQRHPVQPLIEEKYGVFRFKQNAIVRFLLDNGPHDLNALATEKFSQEDREQFAQLIGYSLSGFSDLSYVSDKTYAKAACQEIKVGLE